MNIYIKWLIIIRVSYCYHRLAFTLRTPCVSKYLVILRLESPLGLLSSVALEFIEFWYWLKLRQCTSPSSTPSSNPDM